ncbi:hypothetical protein [Actinocrispum sp. NPDC049592]|uniref:hypothetical protein n=1 Tax=Actinocrispum sp. NPDC049592 TaxID=3154835 RepID=UPI003443ACD5
MTDPIDLLLRDAGEEWRATQPQPPRPDTSRWPPARRTTRLAPLIAAASVVALAAAAVVVLTRSDGPGSPANGSGMGGPPNPGTGDTTIPRAAEGVVGMEGLIVHDGDLVEASGQVETRPGKPVLFCEPIPVADVGYAPGQRPSCIGLPVTGVDLDKLADPAADGDIRTGMARLRGIWRSGTFTVTQQLPYVREPVKPPVNAQVPCATPPGGWQPKDTGPPLGDTLQNYVNNVHPDQFKHPWTAYPYGGPPDGRTENWNSTSVLVVEVVKGDVDEARRELEKRYPGNLCVISSPGQQSIADYNKVKDIAGQQVRDLAMDQSNGVYGSSIDISTNTINVRLKMLTPQLYERLKAIPGLHLEPWFVPVN